MFARPFPLLRCRKDDIGDAKFEKFQIHSVTRTIEMSPMYKNRPCIRVSQCLVQLSLSISPVHCSSNDHVKINYLNWAPTQYLWPRNFFKKNNDHRTLILLQLKSLKLFKMRISTDWSLLQTIVYTHYFLKTEKNTVIRLLCTLTKDIKAIFLR